MIVIHWAKLAVLAAAVAILIASAYDLGREDGCTEEMELQERYS